MRALLERLNLTALSTRERALVGIAVVGVIVFIGTMVGLWFKDKLDESERRIEQKQSGMLKVDALASEYYAAQDKNRQNVAKISRNRINLFTYVDEAARRNGISLTEIKEASSSARKGARKDTINEEAVQVKINKTDMNMLVRFLEEIESRDKLVVLKSMTLKRRYDNDKLLDAKMKISTFKKKKG